MDDSSEWTLDEFHFEPACEQSAEGANKFYVTFSGFELCADMDVVVLNAPGVELYLKEFALAIEEESNFFAVVEE